MPITIEDLEILPIKDGHDTNDFDCGDSDLNDFVRTDCHGYRDQWLSHTLLAKLRETGQLVGFITLSSDAIILKTKEKKKLIPFHRDILQFPALKIGRLGVQNGIQRGGVGKALLEYTIGVAFRMNIDLNIGCRFLTVDAYPKSVSWYVERGFVFNLAGQSERKNRSMRYDLFREP
jgi:GNAT superfamily N-acetyltransferase